MSFGFGGLLGGLNPFGGGSTSNSSSGGILGGDGSNSGGFSSGGIGNHKSNNFTENDTHTYATNNQNTGTTFETNILGNPSSVTLTDGGTVAQSYGFATHALDKSYSALDQSKSAYDTTRDALQNAYRQSLNFVGKQTQPESATTTKLVWGVLAAAVLLAIMMRK